MKKIESKTVHSGERDRKRQNRSITIPIEQTAAYYFKNTRQIKDFYQGKIEGIKYGRYGCPTQHAVEEKIAKLENTDRALLFSSGMNAITTTILSLVGKNQHILYTDDCYRNTKKFFNEILPKFSIEASQIPINDISNIKKYIKTNTVLFFSEIPTNPFLRIIDLKFIINFTKKKKIITAIDSTFATPINLRPAEYGADIILHSATKYLGGHHDLFAGVVAGKLKFIDKIQPYRDILGGIIDPHTSYLLLRSLQTLAIRMEVHNKNGLAIAEYLERHPKVERVWYPGLKSHPNFILAKKQMNGFGGVITFSLKTSEKNTSKFIDSLKIPYIATNFGGPQSLIEQHAILTFYKERDEANKRNIKGNLLRYSAGFENINDVTTDFKQAFKKI
ncbi:cystathionine gamma-synthase [Candidatus Falkowbacteria bacterium CG_4_9_14_3_um_filter_36_9]|uniref:Cystathionine gamma-synthase n=1 Tax=Candidatus Falkowbacteria bacterium CG02_land_8_20_14_3_00_36_14 TaxID=1974560 RepID=A0A2M7DQC4_9BACT|nr:MAG: cystathionine gamma-synthase [Candidatus Falkowbacteria bacterium CG02_land_8_20_14_3_00_36_14]PIX11368.1 MAG: cystathionine gamma-synthase [Candidatus Falkowbacteria bacterium CG_4_8_14_3_um_filter_36_11]PJA10815.1 MAG: cystathionine gamma-synthase [Candidatus Falkowbacteria bacterium CG_4_10_14_0_2_um_filter_36_22]PJB18589.1 MAG: cystathionine gamma-synthase [Candidatus Falkowbacteria bacterium CG_4_9_14_3_um_filter_36_9]